MELSPFFGLNIEFIVKILWNPIDTVTNGSYKIGHFNRVATLLGQGQISWLRTVMTNTLCIAFALLRGTPWWFPPKYTEVFLGYPEYF